MKQVLVTITEEYTYSSREERDLHVAKMEELGWDCSGQVRRLKPDVLIQDANNKDENYDWFASFTKRNCKDQ